MTPYGFQALTGELEKLARAVEGDRNNTLNEVWLKTCHLIAAAHLDKIDAARQVYDTARQVGLEDGEIRATMASAESGARQSPRDRPPPRQGGFGGRSVAPPSIDQVLTPGPDSSTPTAASLPEEFWAARGWLGCVRQAAWSRGRCAEAVLGAALARIAAITPHTVKLPPMVGARVGLSLIVALVGPPGTGKSSSKAIAAELIPRAGPLADRCDDVPAGSGEGLIEMLFDYKEDDDGKKIKTLARHNAFVYIDEGETLAMQARRGSTNTIVPVIRSAFSGATLGQANAAAERKRIVRGGHYVYGIVLGIQPDKAADLLGDAGGGTPQRFLWAPADAPTPPPGQRPPWPDGPTPISQIPSIGRYARPEVGGWIDLQIAEPIRAEVEANDHRRQQHGAAALDQHADLVRLKVAGLLAVADGRLDVGAEDWALAGMAMAVSDATRDRVVAAVAQTRKAANTARGRDEAERDDVRHGLGFERACKAIVRKLDRAGGPVGRKPLRDVLGVGRDHFEAAVEHLETAGMISVERDDDGGIAHVQGSA